MLAKFENGYYLEVTYNEIHNEYCYEVFDEDLDSIDDGWTEYRDIELYYPMNLIDYILEYCKPDDLEGSYEILGFDTMDELEEDPDGEWVLERQGTDNDDIRCYKSAEAARTIMLKEIEDDYEDYSEQDLNGSYCEVRDEEFFQSWNIYKKETFVHKSTELLYKIYLELDRIDTGITQYAYELQDTSVVRDHVSKLRELFIQLGDIII